MAQQSINFGAAANDGTGDDFRLAFRKTDENFDELFASVATLKSPTNQVVVNLLSDLPAPVANIITLSQDTLYLVGADIDQGINTIQLSDGASYRGLDNITVTQTYTGTGNMFTAPDATARISNLGISCTSGRFISWVDTLGKVLRLTDLTLNCDRLATFTGSGSVVRLTNVSPTTMTSDGMSFSGTFLALLYDVSLANIASGTVVDLGTATFTRITLSDITSDIAAGATFLSGLASSGNVIAGGTASVFSTTTSGAGTILSGVTVDDALWQFLLNDDIPDTRPDGLLSMQSNAAPTTISVAGTYVLVAGTWTVERVSQFTGTAAGRLTYNGGKDAVMPVTISVSVEPVSGAAKDISVRYALNGTTVASSTRTARTSSGSPTSITLPWQDNLSPAGFIEVFITNETDTVDVLVSSAISRAN